MSTAESARNRRSEARARAVEVTADAITAHLEDGRTISVPFAWSWRLSEATPGQRANWQLIANGEGIHWPDIDEDISVRGMLEGVPAHRPARPQGERAMPPEQP